MIQEQTRLKVVDNSGGKIAYCIKVLGGSKKRYGKVGDIIVVSIKKALPLSVKNRKSAVKAKEVHKAVIVGTRKKYRRIDGTYLSFDSNNVVIINESFQPIATRIFSPIPFDIKGKKFSKIFALSPFTI